MSFFQKYFSAVLAFSFLLIFSCSFSIFRWDWNKIDTNDLYFPKNFLFGVATSAYQVEGGCDNNQYFPFEGTERMLDVVGDACDHWNKYPEDIQLIKNLNAKSYRFSVEWSKIEPSEGCFCDSALQHYEDVCNKLIENGIKPVITVHHYTEPLWFSQIGAFEKEENIKFYVRFVEKLFDRLGDKVHLWITFSSPVGYAMPGYKSGSKPPYKKNLKLALNVLKNILEAHVQAYKKIKSMPGGQTSKVGITRTIYQLDPVYSWDLFAYLFCSIGNKLTAKPFYEFFTNGVFRAKFPFMVNVVHKNPDAYGALDFIALSYYSHAGVKVFGYSAYPNEKLVSKKDHTIYPEGLYRALFELSKNVVEKFDNNFDKKIPIYITENGIAPLKDEMDRDLFLKRYIYAVSKAIKDGIDVRGYFYWSLMDNYEWGTYNDRYGFYHVDFETQQRTLKPSARHFVVIAARFA